MPNALLWIIVLVEGFVTLSVEILTIRQLIPFVGNSVVVTGIIIGIFLLFLSYGYLNGGKHKNNLTTKLQHNFIISSVIMVIGLSYIFIDAFFMFGEQFGINIFVILISYLLLITAPLVYILGQTVPITVNLVQSKKSNGEVSGKILHLNTIGSFLGSTITTIVLMNYLGVAATVTINAACMLALTVLLMPKISANKGKVCFMLATLSTSLIVNNNFESKFFLKTNAYNNYQLVKNYNAYGKQGNVLVANRSFSSFVDNDNKNGFPYIEAIKNIIFSDMQVHDKKILILGSGAFSLTNSLQERNGNEFYYVDIDKDIFQVSKEHINPKLKEKFFHDDARSFLLRSNREYDIIISDVYSNIVSIPAHLMTVEHYRAIKRNLAKDGIAMFNIIANPRLDNKYSKRIDNTLRHVFANCMSQPLKYDAKMANIIYICFNSEDSDDTIYSDNKNFITTDSVIALQA